MHKSLKKGLLFSFNVIIFFLFAILHYSSSFSFKFFDISATLIIPLLVAFSLYHSPIASALLGMFAGIIMDSCASGSFCFNAIILLIIGTFVSVTSNTLFNKNIPSAVVISLLCSAFYFVAHWFCFYAFSNTINQGISFLLRHSLPSAVLSAVFIFPFYFLYRFIKKL